MDVDLPIVGVGVDYTKVGPIHPKKSLALINHFVTNTSHFLNKFAGVCEKNLEDLNGKIEQMEAVLCILEAKLASIPGLEDVSVSSSSSNNTTALNTTESTTSSNEITPPPPPPTQTVVEEPTPEPEIVEPKMTVAQDPRYARYFKMVQVGVPPEALRQKMLAENLDPELLKTPDAPVPDNGKVENEVENSSDGFSD